MGCLFCKIFSLHTICKAKLHLYLALLLAKKPSKAGDGTPLLSSDFPGEKGKRNLWMHLQAKQVRIFKAPSK
jgi:hypothetical protein